MASNLTRHRLQYATRYIPLFPVCIPAAYYITFKNLPMFPAGCRHPDMANKKRFSTMVRLADPYDKMAKAIRQIFLRYNWARFSLFNREIRLCSYGAQGIYDLFKGSNVTMTDWIRSTDDISDDDIESMLLAMRSRTRGEYLA